MSRLEVYQYLLIGSGSGIFWANGNLMPLIKPSTNDEINGIIGSGFSVNVCRLSVIMEATSINNKLI